MAALSDEVGISTLVIVGIWVLAGFCSLLIHLKRHWDSSSPISFTLAWMKVFKRHELPLLVQLLDQNDPIVEDVRDEITKLQIFTVFCTFQLRDVQERDGWFPTKPWESKLERDTETASAWTLVRKVNELLSAVEMKALNGILGDKTQSAATSIAGGNVPGDVGLGGGVPGSVVPGDGTLSGSVHMAKE